MKFAIVTVSAALWFLAAAPTIENQPESVAPPVWNAIIALLGGGKR